MFLKNPISSNWFFLVLFFFSLPSPFFCSWRKKRKPVRNVTGRNHFCTIISSTNTSRTYSSGIKHGEPLLTTRVRCTNFYRSCTASLLTGAIFRIFSRAESISSAAVTVGMLVGHARMLVATVAGLTCSLRASGP